MRIDLDLCCLKRPFDDQSQPRIRLESEAVLALLRQAGDRTEFIRSAALDLENEQNPLRWRAARVRMWLEAQLLVVPADAALTARTAELMSMGFKNFDAFHLASAELTGCDAFSTTDDRLLAGGQRHPGAVRVRVMNPVDLAREVLS